MRFYDTKNNVRDNAYHVETDVGQFENAIHNSRQVELSTTDTGSLSFTTRGPDGTGFWIDWGDGSAREWVAHTGINNSIVTTHNYSGLTGTKPILFEGNLHEFVRFKSDDTTIIGKTALASAMDNVTNLQIFNSSGLTGDIAAITNLSNLSYLDFRSSGVSGDVASLATLTSLQYLYLHVTSVTGDVGDLATLTNIINMRINSTSVGYNTTTLPAWSNTDLRFQDCAWTQSEVDNFLVDLDTAGGTNGSLDVSGTNAAPSGTGTAARTSLLGKGWTVTVS